MQYSRLSNRIINTKLIIDKQVAIHIIPELGTTVTDILPNLNMNFNNIYSQIISLKPLKIANSIVNPKEYYQYAKNNEEKLIHNVSTSLPISFPINKFIIIDHTSISKSLSELTSNYNPKVLSQQLSSILKYNFEHIKALNPKLKQLIIFQCQKEDGLLQILSNLRKLESSDLKFIDNYALISIHDNFIPILNVDEKGNVEFNQIMLNNAYNLINLKIDEPVSEPKPIEVDVNDDSKKTINIANDNETVTDVIEKKQMSKALDNINLNHPTIISNVQKELATQNTSDNEELSAKIFKTIHKTLHGTEEISPAIKADPNQLIKQMIATTSFAKKLERYPEPIHNIHALSPDNIIKLKNFTGPVRHEYEFNETIHNDIHHLFSSLEKDPTNPVKITDFKYEYKDDDLNRFIEYTITVRNTIGGRTGNYDIKLKIPALVNGRYFKLNGNNYIISNQQFLVPITKDNQNEARFITHYNMARLSTVNLKFNIHQIKEILSYIQIKYPLIIKSFEKNSKGETFKMEFNDELDTKIDISSHVPFRNNSNYIKFDNNEYMIFNNNNDVIVEKINKNEYIYDKIVNILGQIDPLEKLKRTRKSISFMRIHIMGRKIPLIMFMWQQCGLINTLVKYGIDYEINVTPKTNPFFTLPLQNDKKLFLYTDNIREELIVNGLFVVYKLLEGLTEKDLNDPSKIELIIDNKYGTKTSAMFNLAVKTFIDPTTKDLLEYEKKPTDLIKIIDGPLIEKLLNSEPDDPSDLKNLRVRQSEVIAHLLYREMAMAMNKYKQDLSYGMDDAHIFMQPDYIINNLLGKHIHDTSGGSMLSFVNPFSPIEEITVSSRVIKTGVGGIPNLRAFKKEARDISPEHAIAISALGTSEYVSVGAVNTHSLDASISDKYGIYLHRKITNDFDHADSLSISEMLVP